MPAFKSEMLLELALPALLLEIARAVESYRAFLGSNVDVSSSFGIAIISANVSFCGKHMTQHNISHLQMKPGVDHIFRSSGEFLELPKPISYLAENRQFKQTCHRWSQCDNQIHRRVKSLERLQVFQHSKFFFIRSELMQGIEVSARQHVHKAGSSKC
jgi:hypothetical protein